MNFGMVSREVADHSVWNVQCEGGGRTWLTLRAGIERVILTLPVDHRGHVCEMTLEC